MYLVGALCQLRKIHGMAGRTRKIRIIVARNAYSADAARIRSLARSHIDQTVAHTGLQTALRQILHIARHTQHQLRLLIQVEVMGRHITARFIQEFHRCNGHPAFVVVRIYLKQEIFRHRNLVDARILRLDIVVEAELHAILACLEFMRAGRTRIGCHEPHEPLGSNHALRHHVDEIGIRYLIGFTRQISCALQFHL